MKRERIIRVVAGALVLTGTLLSYFSNINRIWLAVFVGLICYSPGSPNGAR